MNKKPLIVVAVLIALGAGAYLSTRGARGNDRTLYGNVDIRELALGFRVGGRVSATPVDEGASVKTGDVLAQIDSAPLTHSLHVAQASLAAAQARNQLLHKGPRQEDIAQAQARLQGAEAALAEAQRQWTRQNTLVPDGAAPQRALDAALNARQQAEAQVKAASEQVAALRKGFRAEEIAESDAQVKLAQAHLDAAQLALDDATLKAPSDGVVLTRAVEVGSLVPAGSAAFTLSLTAPVRVRAYVNEPQLGLFGTGTQVSVHTDAGQTYHGVVGFVSPTAEFTPKAVETTDLRTALVYRLRVVVKDADAQLRQGMPVTVKLAP